MHLRKLTLAIGLLGGALCSNLAHGLGLGEITLKSALDEPLEAEIKLLQVRDLTSGEIIIGLASIDDFKRAGVDRVFFLQDLKFEVLLNNPGGPIVKVTSRKPVQEPYVNFLVQTRWPSGRLLREYTLLLDLPVFADRPVQPVQPSRTVTQSQPAPMPAPVRPSQPEPTRAAPIAETTPVQPSTSSSAVQPQPQQPRYADNEYAVKANDTLWEIALQVRPSRSVSVQQTMIALQRVNPDAFINDNINLLKKGQILRIPDQNEIEDIQQREAVGNVAYQNDQWSGSDASGAQLEGSSASAGTNVVDEEPRGQLTLAAPSDVETSSQSSGSGDASETTVLENDLAVNLEELDSARRESDELNGRVEELDDQIDTIERLIDVSSEEMRALQLAAENTTDDATEAVDDLGTEIETSIDGSLDAISETADEATDTIGDSLSEAGDSLVELGDDLVEESSDLLGETDEDDVSDSATELASTPEVATEAPAAAPAPQAQSKSFMDIIMDNLWYIIGAIVALIGGAGYFMHRKTQAEMAAFDELDDGFYEEENLVVDESLEEEQFEDQEAFEEEAVAEEEIAPEEEQVAVPTESETGDAVGEADIYIAYGKFDQAEEMLQRAIIADPNNVPARLKLLEVYSETKDVEKFDVEYAQLMELNDTSANQQAEELRSRIPDAGEFSIGAAAIAATTAAGTFAGDISDKLDFGDDAEEAVEDASATLDSLQSDLSADFEAATDSGSVDLGSEDLGLDDISSDDGALGGLDLDAPSGEPTDFGEISLDFESEESSAADSDAELTLDLDDATESLEEGGDFELDLDLGDLDDAVNEASGEVAEASDDLGAIDFELDLDASDDIESAEAQTEDISLELSTDDAVEEVADEIDAGLTLDLDDGSDDTNVALSDDDDFLSDLEFSAASQAPESSAAAPAEAENKTLDDAFDLDMEDMDLAALDEEMDALVGDLDDLDETELAKPPVDTVADLADTAEESLDSLSLDDNLEDTTNLDEMISLDEPSLDELSVDMSSEVEDVTSAADAGIDTSAEALSYDETDLGEGDIDGELDFLADTDEVATKLDLARAYIDMGDTEGAKDILEEVVNEGNEEQQVEAKELIERI